MEYVPLGNTDVQVSRIALGCMGFADPVRGVNPWTLDEQAAGPIFRRAVELGITLWDTANVYGGGTSEEIVGRAVRKYTRREEVVIATKVGLPMHDGPAGSGLSRKAILAQVDASLTRLGTDYIDLYQVHRFDPRTPVDETMEALHEVVAAGKVRYIGASSMWAWQFAKMQHSATHHGHTRFVSMQNQYSLVQREDEREMFPLLADQCVSSLPWCPLAKGRLARPYGQVTGRSASDPIGQRFFGDVDRPIVEAVHRIAATREVPMAQVALAWVLDNPTVAAPVIGATSSSHLDDAVAALAVQLDKAEIDDLESRYTPRQPTGF
ncbi:aldo/keto reductase [Streptomyces sp. NPDC002992]|uniref:aldo/keto reductase n=1 Tax=Streptomyces sp. NPDC002992 TaxID=3154273 RepID=UPI0033B99DA4